MTTESTFVLLFTIATAVAIAVRRFAIPYTVALVVVGLALGALNVVEAPHLTKELLFAVILPGLIFEAAFNLDVGESFGAIDFRSEHWPFPGLLSRLRSPAPL
jgi:monovalent cation:H+ antiporter, CPA1 family